MDAPRKNKPTNSRFIIQFPLKISPKNFEKVLERYYLKSLLEQNSIVEFDFSGSNWCDIFELSAISLWMLELKKGSKLIIFKFPNDQIFKNFLISYQFETFLDSNEFQKENFTSSSIIPISPLTNFRRIYPLTFFTKNTYNSILDDLIYENRLEIMMSDFTVTEIVKKGLIRDVVLRELIDNLRIHAYEANSNIIMTNFRKSFANNESIFERAFFKNLRGEGYLSLIISDRGDGIHQKLKDSYLDDKILPAKEIAPTDQDILKYSFFSHSTSRNLEERIGEIVNVLSDEEKKISPDTGLFRLREVVREFRGLLYARSGSAIICYDFLSNPSLKIPSSNLEFNDWKKITNIGGTQFKLLFPVNVPERPPTYSIQFDPQLPAEYQHYSYLPIQDYLQHQTSFTFKEEAEIILEVSDEFDRLALAHRKTTIIIDFENVKTLSSKAQHYILYKAMQRQTDNTSAIAINIESYHSPTEPILNEIINNTSRLLPLCLIDKFQIVGFFGLSESDSTLLLKFIRKEGIQTNQIKKLAEQFNHLFELDLYKQQFQLLHSIEQINLFVKEEKRKQISKLIENENIFKKEQRVLLPSKMYCEGYFEVRRVIEKPVIFNNLTSWLSYWLFETRPDFIISVSGQIGEIAASALKVLHKGTSKKIRYINIKTPINDNDLVNLMFDIKIGEKGIIFTEVVGSAKTLKSIFRNCQKGEIIKVFTIVDAIGENSYEIEQSGEVIKIESILKHSQTYYPVLPPNWRYSQISQVDKNTHFLIPPFKFDRPGWKIVEKSTIKVGKEDLEVYTNRFFEDCIIPENLFYEGHFLSGNNHLLYFFDIPKLADKFGYEISESISEKVERVIGPVNKPLTHIIYLEKNPGVASIAEQISSRFNHSITYSISNDMLDTDLGELTLAQKMESVLIIDDALVTGETMLKVYDLVKRMGASFIIVFTLINRGNDYILRLFNNITEYGEIKVEFGYLAEARISNYLPYKCPVCHRKKELIEISNRFNDEFLSEFIKTEIIRLDVINISDIEKNTVSLPFPDKESLILRWKLELAKDKKQLAVRKELTTKLKSYRSNPKSDPKSALTIINILSKEKTSFIFDQNIASIIFYKSFVEELIKSCWHLIKDNNLSAIEHEGVFLILTKFDNDKLMNDLPKILNKTLDSTEKFLRCLVVLLNMEEASIYPGRLKQIFKNLENSSNISKELQKTAGHAFSYWSNEEEKIENLKNDRIAHFKRITGGILHEEEHIKAVMINSLKSNLVNISQVETNWSSFHSKVSEIAPLIRGFTYNFVSDGIVEKLNQDLKILQNNLDRGNQAVKELVAGNNDYISDSDPSVSELKKVVENIDQIIKGSKGIEQTLDSFKTDIRGVISNVIDEWDRRLKQKNINIKKELPKDACLVFGENMNIYEIFANLVINALEWSNAKNLIIRVELDSQTEMAKISFIDDGIGIDANKQQLLEDKQQSLFNNGLINVRKMAYSNCGKFEIIEGLGNSEDYLKGFKTHLLVTLPYFKVKE